MIEYKEEKYNLKLNLNRLEIIEKYTNKTIVNMLSNANISISDLRTVYSYCLIKEGASSYVDPKLGNKIFEELIEQKGMYANLMQMFAEAIERDCAFLFPEA